MSSSLSPFSTLKLYLPPLSVRQWRLLAVITAIWGFNWPVMKYAINQYPPLSFRFLSMLGGVVVMQMAARWMKIPLQVPAGQRLKLFLLAMVNMVGWHVFCVLAVAELSSGRAAILGYTMPVWAVMSGLFLGQRISIRAWIGVGFAVGGIFLLLGSELSSIAGRPLGAVYMLIAAICWGMGTALIRRFPTGLHPLAATHAMMCITLFVMGVAAWHIEWTADLGLPHDFKLWWPIVYNAVLVIGVAHVLWIGMAASLPPVASSISIMLIPVVGVFSGMLWLGETPHWQDYAALCLILTAMGTVLLVRPSNR
ncbi:MAG: DMT family transporter [Burkholderiales bacterium]|nr:DMT family transporter [Burkholderiales bacterium]